MEQTGRPGGCIHPLWFTLGLLSLAANPNLLMSLVLEVKFLAVLYETVSEFDQEAEPQWLLWTKDLLEDLDIIGLTLHRWQGVGRGKIPEASLSSPLEVLV